MITKLNLDEMKTPVIELTAGGETRIIDPFELAPKLESMLTPDLSLSQTIRVLREVFALGPDKASDVKVIELHKRVVAFCEEQIRSKPAPQAQQT